MKSHIPILTFSQETSLKQIPKRVSEIQQNNLMVIFSKNSRETVRNILNVND